MKIGVENVTRPAWAGFKTAEEGRAKICKFLWQKLQNKSNIEKDCFWIDGAGYARRLFTYSDGLHAERAPQSIWGSILGNRASRGGRLVVELSRGSVYVPTLPKI